MDFYLQYVKIKYKIKTIIATIYLIASIAIELLNPSNFSTSL